MFKCVDCMCVIKTYTMDWAWTIEKLWLYIFAWNFIQILNNDWDLSLQWLIILMVLMQFSVKPAIFIIIDLSNYTKNIEHLDSNLLVTLYNLQIYVVNRSIYVTVFLGAWVGIEMDLGREALKQCPLSTHELVHIYDGESVRLNSN